MVLSSSQQVVMAFTAVLLVFVLFPRMFGSRESQSFDPRISRRGPGPGLGPGSMKSQQQAHVNGAPPKSQNVENMHQMKKLMEQELKSDKYKSNSNKGYVFTLMPIYAIGVGLFAAYKFMKIKSASDSESQRAKTARGVKKSEETENQLNELEQRLAQTEKMLNSILTQLDPLTNCVKSVAMEQKNEIMSQLQCIRHLMKKRGMECPNIRIEEPACERNLDKLIESLAAAEALPETQLKSQTDTKMQSHDHKPLRPDSEVEEGQEDGEEDEHEEEEVDNESDSSMPSLEDTSNISEDVTIAQNVPDDLTGGLRRRNRPE
ncbi:coiled-coil domain-containing protein 107-like [Myxocyprinus asiaticus]|uniref:coiled-coil domain-containing protein 107-like n=1 Tax=Myxocyprinus asiaticus TaxID=70543 RepID=UPI002223CD7B|nr:coiled-coil domain-containing protein 107-like [Myxocyprinus asiaticus]